MARQGKQLADLSLNLTPMIDCVFQLMLFFILTSQAASQLIVPVELAHPLESKAIAQDKLDSPHKVIVNVVSAEPDNGSSDPLVMGKAVTYRINNRDFTTQPVDMDALRSELRAAKDAGGDDDGFCLEIRGDKKVHFAFFEPLMRAAGDAGISRMNISARVD